MVTAFPGQTHAAMVTETSTMDSFDVVCNEDCSLWEAIAVASTYDVIDIPTGNCTSTFCAQTTIHRERVMTGTRAIATVVEVAA